MLCDVVCSLFFVWVLVGWLAVVVVGCWLWCVVCCLCCLVRFTLFVRCCVLLVVSCMLLVHCRLLFVVECTLCVVCCFVC